jgi:hypothetical protein
MRTTVDLPDPLFREMKSLAARQGRSMKELLVEAIESKIAKTGRRSARHSIKLPLIRSKNPGALRSMTNADIEDLLD